MKKYIKNLSLPAFLPDATYGSIKSVTISDLKKCGIQGIVTTTLHIEDYIGSEYIKSFGGFKNFIGWDGFVLTDSGGWQVFSLINSKKDTKNFVTNSGCSFFSSRSGKHIFLSPEISIAIQSNLFSDVLTALDFPILGDAPLVERKECIKINTEWAKRSMNKYKQIYNLLDTSRPLIGCVIQGGNDFELRKISAESLLELNFDLYNFGGIPMYYGETWKTEKEYRLFHEMLVYVSNLIPKDKIKYAMGVGQPKDIAFCTDFGWDLFDTVLPTRNARHGFLYVSPDESLGIHSYNPQNLLKSYVNQDDLSYSILRIKNSKYAFSKDPVDKNCDCECCKTTTRSYLRYLLKINEPAGYRLATIHNLTFYSKYINKLKINF